jgi:uncharacterized LabA/DUF88 family protein
MMSCPDPAPKPSIEIEKLWARSLDMSLSLIRLAQLAPMTPLISQNDSTLRRWMLFVDGENFTFRAQEFAQKHNVKLEEGRYHKRDVFVWLPGIGARESIVPNAPVSIQASAFRAFYYTSIVGDDQRLTTVREDLWNLGFHPEVFKKEKQRAKSKGVDIALAKDFLSNAFMDNYDAAVLIAGDADYIPMVNEVKRLGKLVYVIFFHEKGCGLSRVLQTCSDEFFKIDESFSTQWREHLGEGFSEGRVASPTKS